MQMNCRFPVHEFEGLDYAEVMEELAYYHCHSKKYNQLFLSKMIDNTFKIAAEKKGWSIKDFLYRSKTKKMENIDAFVLPFFQRHEEQARHYCNATVRAINAILPALHKQTQFDLLHWLDQQEITKQSQIRVKRGDFLNYPTLAQVQDATFVAKDEVILPILANSNQQKYDECLLVKTQTQISFLKNKQSQQLNVFFLVPISQLQESLCFKALVNNISQVHSSLKSLNPVIQQKYPHVSHCIDLTEEKEFKDSSFVEKALLCLLNPAYLKEIQNFIVLLKLYRFSVWICAQELEKNCIQHIKNCELMTIDNALDLLQQKEKLSTSFLNYLYDFIAMNRKLLNKTQRSIYKNLDIEHLQEVVKRINDFRQQTQGVKLDITQLNTEDNTWSWQISNDKIKKMLQESYAVTHIPFELYGQDTQLELQQQSTYGYPDHINFYLKSLKMAYPMAKTFKYSCMFMNKNTGKVIGKRLKWQAKPVYHESKSSLGHFYPSDYEKLKGADLIVKLTIHPID